VRVEVFFGTSGITPQDIAGRVVAMIDVLRASTTIAAALDNGARAVIPLENSDEAIRLAKTFERRDLRLAGERRMLPIPGFDLGNSPGEFTRQAVEGKTILMTTTNGTAALAATQGARDVIVASYVNFSASLSMLRAALRGETDVAIICAGREKHFAFEDAGCAGRYVRHASRRLVGVKVNDAAHASVLIDKKYGDNIERLLGASEHARALHEAGFGDDIAACAKLDAHPVIPVYQDRQITKLGPDRER
jgi:2-phosphosulfolactate phosphatase